MIRIPPVLTFFLVAGCVEEDGFVTEADISEANRNTECPDDI